MFIEFDEYLKTRKKNIAPFPLALEPSGWETICFLPESVQRPQTHIECFRVDLQKGPLGKIKLLAILTSKRSNHDFRLTPPPATPGPGARPSSHR